jgi:hypothetical protein
MTENVVFIGLVPRLPPVEVSAALPRQMDLPRSAGANLIYNFGEKYFENNWLAIFIEPFLKLEITHKLKTNCCFHSPKNSPAFFFHFINANHSV